MSTVNFINNDRFAIIQAGGKQHRVSEGLLLKIERTNKHEGELIEINEVVAISEANNFTPGKPFVPNAKVVLEILKQDRDDKVLIFKKKRRKNYQRLNGHRQSFDLVKVKSISVK